MKTKLTSAMPSNHCRPGAFYCPYRPSGGIPSRSCEGCEHLYTKLEWAKRCDEIDAKYKDVRYGDEL